MAQTKEQAKAWNKKHYLENKEKYNAKATTWAKANREKKAACQKAWAKNNPDKMAANLKKYLLKLSLANKDISRRTLHAWSAQVKARDTACLYCGSTKKLHAHHILSKSKHPEHALFLNNGITLCEACHIQEHLLNGDI